MTGLCSLSISYNFIRQSKGKQQAEGWKYCTFTSFGSLVMGVFLVRRLVDQGKKEEKKDMLSVKGKRVYAYKSESLLKNKLTLARGLYL